MLCVGTRVYLTSPVQYERVILLPTCLFASFSVQSGHGYADFATVADAQAARLEIDQ